MVRWKRKELMLLAKGLGMFLVGTFLITWFGNLAIYFWMNDVSTLQVKEFRGASLGLSFFFFGVGLVFWSVFIFEKIVKNKGLRWSAFRRLGFSQWIKQKEEVEAVEWEHFKVKEQIEETENSESNISKIVKELKISPKPQMLTRANKDIIKTTQPNAVLNEEDVEKIKNSLNFTNIQSKL
jgi:hypothetical protein